MELELSLHPDDAGRLTRLRAIAAAIQGRPRMQRQRVIWHDTADQALARAGMSLAEERGHWRLEQLTPDAATWLPAAPAPVLERAATPADFEHPLPAPVAAVAGFDGRLATYSLAGEQGSIMLGLLRGSLRSVAEEQPTCRVLLAGDEPMLRELACAAGEELRLAVPVACLAAEALALAHAVPPAPRRQGAPILPDGLSVAAAFAHILGHLTDVMLHFAAAVLDPRSGPEPVHQMRVALRRLRSCFAVFRPVVQCEQVQAADAALKALGNRLGPARDWDVFMTETVPTISASLPDDARLQRLFRAADRRRQECYAGLRGFLQGPGFRRLGIELAWLAAADSWQAALEQPVQDALRGPVPPFAAEVLQRRLRKLLGAAEEIEDMPLAALHDIRLRAKRLRYAAEVFAPLFPGKAPRRFIERLSRLQQQLGVLNDAVVAGALMAELEGASGRHAYAVGVVHGFTVAHAGVNRDRVLDVWRKFRRQEPFWE